jgi:hypothetical protein
MRYTSLEEGERLTGLNSVVASIHLREEALLSCLLGVISISTFLDARFFRRVVTLLSNVL